MTSPDDLDPAVRRLVNGAIEHADNAFVWFLESRRGALSNEQIADALTALGRHEWLDIWVDYLKDSDG